MKEEQQVPPGIEEVLRAIISETEGLHGNPHIAKIWELAQIALYQSKLPPASLDRSVSQPGSEEESEFVPIEIVDKWMERLQDSIEHGSRGPVISAIVDEYEDFKDKKISSQILRHAKYTAQTDVQRLMDIRNYIGDGIEQEKQPIEIYEGLKTLFDNHSAIKSRSPPPGEQAIEVLNRQIQERDNRIKELWTDEQVCAFLKWVQIERWHFIEGGKWGHDYKTFSGFPVFTTTSKLLEEYKKQLTK